jgi:hypothetical protein
VYISIISLIEALLRALTFVSPVVTVTYGCLSLFVGALLLIGILTERPVLMLPAMIFSVCAGEFRKIAV